jgi:hypothetical protein
MPQETKGSAIYRPDLGQAVMEFVEGAQLGFIGLEVMPIFRTSKQASSYPVIPAEALLKLDSVDRAPRATYNRGDWEYERGTFSTAEKGWEEPLDDVERELFDLEAPGIADLVATQRAWNKIMRAQEYRIATTIFNDSTFSANTITEEWDDGTNAVPIDDVETGKVAFLNQCGMLPDALIIAYSTFSDLRLCDQIVDRLKYTFPGIDLNTMNAGQLAMVFGVPRVLVGGSVYDSSGKGIAKSVTSIWSNEYAALVKIGSGQDIAEPCVGRTFLWTEDSPQNPIVESYREEKRRSDIFRVRHHVSEELIKSVNTSGTAVSNVSAACMYLFDNVTT